MTKLTIGLAAGRKYDNYLKWIKQGTDAEIVKLSHFDKNFESVKDCDALIFTGGEDVHPRFYGKPEFVAKYHLDDLDEARDEFELKLLMHSQRRGLPVLGICRGLQIANVHFGGTLIPDIQSIGKPDHRKHEEDRDRQHPVWLLKDSILAKIAGTDKGDVNSAHHQAVEILGDELAIGAVSPDGIIEAAERREKEGPFLLLVQWHPERMIDQQSPFALNIRKSFLEHVVPQRRTYIR